MFESLRARAVSLPPLAKFALGMTLIFGVPAFSRRIRLPMVVGLLLSGVVVGPYLLGVVRQKTTEVPREAPKEVTDMIGN